MFKTININIQVAFRTTKVERYFSLKDENQQILPEMPHL